ncbi:unnamed protein product [Amoebophrya sp. A120]|nr:unnamed protein product [Amoebophrya sp. A120]|eukprot:GSA120T00019070001.1
MFLAIVRSSPSQPSRRAVVSSWAPCLGRPRPMGGSIAANTRSSRDCPAGSSHFRRSFAADAGMVSEQPPGSSGSHDGPRHPSVPSPTLPTGQIKAAAPAAPSASSSSDIPAHVEPLPPSMTLAATRWNRVQEALEVMEKEDRDTLYFRTKILRREEFTVEEMQEYKEVRDWASYEYMRLLGTEIRMVKLTFWTAIFAYLFLWPRREDDNLEEVGGVKIPSGPAWMSMDGVWYGVRKIKEKGWAYTPLH